MNRRMLPAKIYQAAVQAFQQGDLAQARELCHELLRKAPKHAEGLHFAGIVAASMGNDGEAIRLMRKAIACAPEVADFHTSLGTVYVTSQRYGEAEQMYRKAVTLNPRDAVAYHGLGQTLWALAKKDPAQKEEAEQCLKQAIVLAPDREGAYHSLATLAFEVDDYAMALEYGKQAIARSPDPVFYANVGRAYGRMGEKGQAEACYRKAIESFPDHPACYRLYAQLLLEQGDFQSALVNAKRAYELVADDVEVAITLATVYEDMGETDAASNIYLQALRHTPSSRLHFLLAANQVIQGQDAAALQNMVQGFVLEGKNRISGVDCYFRRFLRDWDRMDHAANLFEQVPDRLSAFIRGHAQAKIRSAMLCILGRHTGFLDEHENAESYSQYLLDMHYSQVYTQAEIYSAHCRFNELFALPLEARTKFPKISKDPRKILRLGYVSEDFRDHSVAYFIEPILAAHNPAEVQLFCYYNNRREDAVSRRLKQYCTGGWRNCFEWSDDKLAAVIRQDKIDILLDLMGHTGYNRLLAFARRLAPIQMSYLGYPDTTGLSSMDYRLTDSWVEPAGMAEQFSSERLLRMPVSYFCYQPPDISTHIEVTALPALENGYVTFGSFNIYQKVTDRMIEAWASILNLVPQSRLLLKVRLYGDVLRDFQPMILRRFEHLGIARERLIVKDYARSLELALQIYHQVDICLDTHPYSGATTTCESLWMGCPVVTWYGQHHASRMSLSILSALGLGELATASTDEYIETAVSLAQDPEKLQALRNTMRARMLASPLMDAAGFTQVLEGYYREVWRAWCEANA